MLGYGLSAKPDRAYTISLQADVAAAFVAELGVRELDLLTHDMGDTVGGELLARRAEGGWPVEVRRRVVTNGSIYIEQAHLTDGQLLLLGLPDELLPEGLPLDAASLSRSLRDTFSPATPTVPTGWADDPVPAAAAMIVRHDGQRSLAAPDPLHRGAPRQRAALHGGHRGRPGAAARCLGARRPDRRAVHGGHAGSPRPDATVERLEGTGHYPMIEAPRRFLDAVLPGLA